MKLRKMIALLMALALLCGYARAAQYMDGYAQAVVSDLNAERARQGLGALRVDAELTRAARVRAEEISRRFSHTRPDGSRGVTASPLALGENIARGHKTPDKVMAAWLTSSGHRATIFRPGWGSVGVACLKSGGVYHWVQLFGK